MTDKRYPYGLLIGRYIAILIKYAIVCTISVPHEGHL